MISRIVAAQRRIASQSFRGVKLMRISMFPPVSIVSELLDGPLEGSTMVYLYSPKGLQTQIDVYGEFTSKTLPANEIESAARARLASEFSEDVPAVRRLPQGCSTPEVVFTWAGSSKPEGIAVPDRQEAIC